MFHLGLFSQGLIANGSFEDRNTCTEFHALCAPEAWFFIPQYIKSSPVEDSNNIEILAIGKNSNLRNHIYTKLLCPLEKGEKYQFSIKIKSTNEFEFLDVWMGADEPGLHTESKWIENPRLTIVPENGEELTRGWNRYVLTFTAVGDERYLMLGSLKPYIPYSKLKGRRTYTEELHSIDDVALHNVDHPGKVCREYAAISQQIYAQNFRHPPRFIEDIPIDVSLFKGKNNQANKNVTWIIVDTPPSIKKPVGDTLIIPDVLFETNSSKINNAFLKRLDNILNKISSKKYKQIEVIGHTDNEGSDEYNQQLSISRAIAIRDYIASKNLFDVKDIEAIGVGENQPRASNKTPGGRQQNRRVEIILR
jgi:outer membrane protein OmpA-like peptidoglycan-associated protein